ncbi:LOW QUALITY PROTEIN: uncharacterized protein LOC121876666 [Homarus americanus]|uniref:LOW QUALITY PROTEIN: uncharacterized protein LOC121876666 n=1 Tax=Homarus americanus TaxID=6706 RepID=UPI001C489CFE|nr:LOW QUALITY PROTEIN: uncharacterized protein LOC121876666 [Homarus americanus]
MVMVVALAPYLVWAQLGASPENSTVENCECSPACEGGVGGGGCRGRVMAREDCPCCRVCAQQAGDPCSLPSLPCDKEFGLVCSPEGVCQAEFACASDPECPDDRFCLGGVCVDPCPILTPCSGALKGGVCVSKDHRPVCECPSGTIANSDAKLCIPYNGTETGCQHEERLYAVDEVRYSDKCQEQCRCGSDGTFSCGPVTCPPGLFLAGQHSQQEMCIELRNRPETDECCVVVACANSLARPSLLTSPVLSRPSLGVEEHDGQQLQVLRGRKAGPGIPSPITGEEYQKQLKELEVEVNKKHEKKKTTDVKESEQHKQGGSDAVAVVGDAVEEAVDAPVTEVVTELGTLAGEEEVTTPPWDVEGSVQETVDEVTEAEGFTTLMPTTQEEEQVRDGEDAALVLEYDDTGDLVHRITVHERVEVVTQPATLEEETSTPPTQQEEETSLAREGKKAPDDANVTQDEPTDTESIKLLEAKGGSGALKVVEVTHNSSTVVLPSSKGGEVYYKAAEGNEWLRVMVESGQDSLVLKGLHPSTQYTLKWSGVSGGSAKITIDTQEVCRVGNETYAIGHNWAQGCQERCSCRPGGVVDCQPRCIFAAGDITNPQCEERPAPEDPECCVVYDCKSDESDITGTVASGAQENAGLPKLLVTAKTHNSVTLAWDDFRARTYKGGYVAEYREEPADPATGIVVEQPWMRKEVPPGELPPKLTVEGLRPNTLYEVRVSIYDDVEEGRLGEATETINVKTEAGCVYGNSSHSVGEFYNGCEERCMCVATGDVQCFERCTLPYFRAGSFRGDPLCSEHPDERDECCVTVRCASDRREAYNQCTNVVCGQNAECISGTMASKDLRLSDIDSDLTLGYCRCLKGFTGDASDLDSGCVPDPSAGHKEGSCTFKNSTYRSGDVFHDECDYRCSCSNNSEIECEPRCEFPHEDGSQTEPGCEYIPDPKDHCCKLRVCNSTSEAATDAARAPSLPSDGCTEGNITYARDEKFYNGCETSCTCLGFGDVSCTPRCPPLKVVSATPKRCDTLPDPLDTCCSITVCDAETPDVMKANITELEKKMMKMNMTDMEKEMKMKEMMMNMTGAEKEALMNISKIERIPNDMDAMMPEEDIATTVMPEKEMLIHLNEHTHDDGTTHSHPHEHGMDETLNHTDHDGQAHDHDKNGQQAHNNHDIFTGIHNHTHTHENGVTHTHPHEHNMDNMHDHEHNMNDTHTHEDGTTHSHPHDHAMDHTHDNDTHTHEDGTTHSHPHDRTMDHTHDNDTHTHEDGTTHSHPHDHTMDHTHDNDTHTHEDGTTHSHPHDRTMDHTHDNDTHTHEDGMTHSHPHDHTMDHTHDNDTHTHEDGTTHSHPHDRTMDHHDNDTHTHEDVRHTATLMTVPWITLMIMTHTHEDGMTHSHPHDHTMDHTHDNDTHTHEDGTTHSHPHDRTMDHTHDNDTNDTHTHEDGTTHSHPHDRTMDHTHDHGINDTHTHEDGTTHSHPHDRTMDHTHDHGTNDTHTHEDGTTHSHPHVVGMNSTHNQEHDMNETHNHTHMWDGVSHIHPGGQEMDEDHNHTHVDSLAEGNEHTHEDGVTHFHAHEDSNHTHMPEDGINDFHNHTSINILEKKNRAEDLGTHDLNILEVMAVNSTTVMIRLDVSNSVMNQIQSSDDQHFMVLYSPDSLIWPERKIPVSEAKIGINEIVLYLNDLKPSTPYQFRVAFQDFVSSTSKARLLDGTVETGEVEVGPAHLGCVAGMQFMEETECGRQCMCQANGQVTCKPRCPRVEVPQDSITSCTLVPSPDDPCCTVPDCLLNLFNHNVLLNSENLTNNPRVNFNTGSMDHINQPNNAHEHENVLMMSKPKDGNQDSSRISQSILVEATDDAKPTSETRDKHVNITDSHHPAKNTLIPEDQVASGRPLKSFISLNDLLNKHNQLGSVPHNTSAVSHRQDENSDINRNITKETSHGFPNTLNKITSSRHNASFILTEGIRNTESTREKSSLAISENEFEHLSDTQDHKTLHLLSADANVSSNTSSVLPPDEIGTHVPNDDREDNPPYLPDSVNENEVGSSTNKDEHDSAFSSSDFEENSHLPIDGREGSILPNEEEENIYDTHEDNVYLPHQKEGNSHLPTDDEVNLYLLNEHGVHPDLADGHTENLHLKENRPKEQRPDSYLPSTNGKLPHHPASIEATVVTEEELLAPVSNKTIIKDGTDGVDIDTSKMCSRNGRHYKPGQDFFEDCASFCICKEDMKIHCAAIECPVNFGLDLKDPNCLEWDQDPHYVPTPPKCCPQVKCIMTSACVYMGQTFNNYDEIPRELTGCSQECSCNYGNVTCRDLCAPVPSIPPPELNCEPQNAVLITLPGETCCRSWQCAAHSGVEFEFLGTTEVVETTQFPGDSPGTLVSFPVPPGSEMSDTHTSGFVPIAHPVNPILGADGIAEPYVTPLDARNVHFFFSTPKHYQGLPGELLIRFTNDPVSQADPSTWSQEILVPMGSIISQSEWDHLLTGLQPSTVYSMQVVLTVHGTEPVTSPVITYTTMEEATPPPTTTPLPRLDINAELYASEITKTTAKVSWRGFDDFELHYIDGVQVKYTEKDKLIPKFSQLFHRDNDQMDLRGLQPGHSYTVDLVFITHENQTTQVSNTKPITFTTLPEEDPYAFEIEVTAGKVASQTAELFYSGVPEPEEKYINVYRAVYLREDERVDAESFKVPKTGHEKKILLHELKPDVEYQVWIEAYLSNGRKKKSNVLTITTRAGQLPKPERSEVDPSTKESKDSEGYYPALVAVAIIAAIACLGFLGLLIILLRKQSHAKAHINSARNNAAYDNPSYKVGDNTYDMEMNGIKGSGNGATHMEEP